VHPRRERIDGPRVHCLPDPPGDGLRLRIVGHRVALGEKVRKFGLSVGVLGKV
jgi:hypothetical protein